MKNKITIIFFLTLLSLLSCSRDSQKEYIEYWCASNTFELEFAKYIVDLWNSDSTHRHIRLQPIPEGQSSEEMLLAAIVGKTTPDIYSNTWPGVVEQYREANVIINFNQFPDFSDYLAARIPENLDKQFMSSDSQFYQFPWKGNPILLAYNKNILENILNSSPPETYDDLEKIGQKIIDYNKNNTMPIWMMDPNISPIWYQRLFDFYPFYVSASQGKTFISPDKQVLLNTSPAKTVFNLFRENYTNGLLPISMFKEDIFLLERLVFHITGPWSIAHYKRFARSDFEWGYTGIPTVENDMLPYTYGDTKNIIIFKDTEYLRECWEFVKFMTSKEADLKFMEMTAQLPLRKDLLSDPIYSKFFNNNPKLIIFAKHIPYVVGLDQSLFLQEIFDMISKTWDAVVIYRVKDLEKGLNDLNSQVRNQVTREYQ